MAQNLDYILVYPANLRRAKPINPSLLKFYLKFIKGKARGGDDFDSYFERVLKPMIESGNLDEKGLRLRFDYANAVPSGIEIAVGPTTIDERLEDYEAFYCNKQESPSYQLRNASLKERQTHLSKVFGVTALVVTSDKMASGLVARENCPSTDSFVITNPSRHISFPVAVIDSTKLYGDVSRISPMQDLYEVLKSDACIFYRDINKIRLAGIVSDRKTLETHMVYIVYTSLPAAHFSSEGGWKNAETAGKKHLKAFSLESRQIYRLLDSGKAPDNQEYRIAAPLQMGYEFVLGLERRVSAIQSG